MKQSIVNLFKFFTFCASLLIMILFLISTSAIGAESDIELIKKLESIRGIIFNTPGLGSVTYINDNIKGLKEAVGFENGLVNGGDDTAVIEKKIMEFKRLEKFYEDKIRPLEPRKDLFVEEKKLLENYHELQAAARGERGGLESRKNILEQSSTADEIQQGVKKILHDKKYKGKDGLTLKELRQNGYRILDRANGLEIKKPATGPQSKSAPTGEKIREIMRRGLDRNRSGFVDFLFPKTIPQTISPTEANRVVKLSEAASIEEIPVGGKFIKVLKIGGKIVAVVAGAVVVADTLKELEQTPLPQWPKKAPESLIYHGVVQPLAEAVKGFFGLSNVYKRDQADKRQHESRKKHFIDRCVTEHYKQYLEKQQKGEITRNDLDKILIDKQLRRDFEQDCLKQFLLN